MDQVYSDLSYVLLIKLQVNGNSAGDGPSTSANSFRDDEVLHDDDEDELDIDELNELEASLAKTSLQIQEPSKG